MLNIIEGDLISLASQGAFDVILHGCNCYDMDTGVAGAIIQAYPSALLAHQQSGPRGDTSRFGGYSHTVVKSETGAPLVILNGYTQKMYGKLHQNFDYQNLRNVCEQVLNRLGGRQLRFGMPLIGVGRGKAEPNKVLDILNEMFANENVTIVVQIEQNRRNHPQLITLIKKIRQGTPL